MDLGLRSFREASRSLFSGGRDWFGWKKKSGNCMILYTYTDSVQLTVDAGVLQKPRICGLLQMPSEPELAPVLNKHEIGGQKNGPASPFRTSIFARGAPFLYPSGGAKLNFPV